MKNTKFCSLITSCLFLTLSLNADSLDSYFALLNQNPATLGPDGDYSKGEIEIIRDREKILELETKTGRPIGIVRQDKYWMWLNDPVRFPNGSYGIYGRIVWNHALKNLKGAAVLPVDQNKRIALNLNYRHATRSWEYEIPRGGPLAGETPEETAAREAREETGLIVGSIVSLGQVAVDSGLTSAIVPVFYAKILSQQDSEVEDSEAIKSIDFFTIEEIKKGLTEGYLIREIEGKKLRVPLRDSFLSFALLQCMIRGLL